MLKNETLSKTNDNILSIDKKVLEKFSINNLFNFHEIRSQIKKCKSENVHRNINLSPLTNTKYNLNPIKDMRKKKTNKCFRKIKMILKGKAFSLLIILAILILLFLEDINVLVIKIEYDIIIDGIIFTAYLFVIIEIILFNIFLKNYRFSFFFFLDLIAILTLIPKIKVFS